MGIRSWLIWSLLPLGIGLVIGFTLKGSGASADSEGTKPDVAAGAGGREKETPKAEKIAERESEPIPVVKTLDDLLAMSRGLDPGNHVRLVAALEGVPGEKIAEWYEQVRYSRSQKAGISRVLADRLARTSPEKALQLAGHGEQMFGEYLARAHPGRIGEFLDSVKDPRVRESLITTHMESLWTGDVETTFAAHREFLEKHGSVADQDGYKNLWWRDRVLTAGITKASGSPEDLIAWNQSFHKANGEGMPNMIPIQPILEKFNSPHAALDFFQANGIDDYDRPTQAQIYGGIGTQWAESDPVAAANWLSGLPEDVRLEAARHMGQGSPSRELFEALPEELRDDHLAGTVARQWVLTDPGPEAVAWYLENSKTEDRYSFGSALSTLVTHDSEAVAQHLIDSPDRLSLLQEWSGSRVFSQLISADPENGARLLEAASAVPDNGKLVERLAVGWATSDLQGAFAMVDGLTDPDLRMAAIRGVVSQSYSGNISASIEWARDLEGAELTRAMIPLSMVADRDRVLVSEAATDWLNRPGIEIDSNNHAIASINNALLSNSAGEATAWIDTLESPEIRDLATVDLSRQWAISDPVAMSEWLVEVPLGEARDEAIGNLMVHISDDMEGSFGWAGSVSNPEKRSEMLGEVVRRWGQRDAEGAREAINNSESLAPEEQQVLLQRLEEQTQ